MMCICKTRSKGSQSKAEVVSTLTFKGVHPYLLLYNKYIIYFIMIYLLYTEWYNLLGNAKTQTPMVASWTQAPFLEELILTLGARCI